MTDRFPTHHRGILDELTRLTAAGEGFTLCVVAYCTGSTYRKPGALAVIAAGGARAGVISGGCLEPDLESAARAVLAEQRPRVVLFDSDREDDLVFGSGSACRGQMHVLLVPVAAGARHPLVQALLAADRAHEPLRAALVTVGPGLGSGFLWSAQTETALTPRVEAARALRGYDAGQYPLPAGGRCAVLSFAPCPRVLLLGAGPEAPALITIADELGWRVTVADHRETLLSRHAAGAGRTLCARPAAALASCAGERFDAALVMTHTAASDREALTALAQRAEPFIGLLGPAARRDELLAELGPAARAALSERLHAPVGLRLGGHGPEILALSICAELQRFFAAAHAACNNAGRWRSSEDCSTG